MESGITRDDWLTAFQQAMTAASQDAGAATVGEIADALHLYDHRRVRLMLKRLITAGDAECLMVQRTMINGVTRHLPGYRLTKVSLQ